MSDTEIPRRPTIGLYVTDAEIIRRWGYSLKRGYRILQSLDRGLPNMRPYPQPDPLFANRRFWPEVFQWHLDYHRVAGGTSLAPTVPRRWQENFDAPTDKASRPQHARPDLAQA